MVAIILITSAVMMAAAEAVLLVELLDALIFLVQLNFGSGHLAFLRQQLVL